MVEYHRVGIEMNDDKRKQVLSLLPSTTTITTVAVAAAIIAVAGAALTANDVGNRRVPANASLLLADDALIG